MPPYRFRIAAHSLCHWQAEVAELSNRMDRQLVEPGGTVMDGGKTDLGLCLLESGRVSRTMLRLHALLPRDCKRLTERAAAGGWQISNRLGSLLS